GDEPRRDDRPDAQDGNHPAQPVGRAEGRGVSKGEAGGGQADHQVVDREGWLIGGEADDPRRQRHEQAGEEREAGGHLNSRTLSDSFISAFEFGDVWVLLETELFRRHSGYLPSVEGIQSLSPIQSRYGCRPCPRKTTEEGVLRPMGSDETHQLPTVA